MATPVWHISTLHKCDVMRTFSANGTTTVEVRKPETSFAPRCHLTCGYLPLRNTDIIKPHLGLLHKKWKQIKDRLSVCTCNIAKTKRATQRFLLGRMQLAGCT